MDWLFNCILSKGSMLREIDFYSNLGGNVLRLLNLEILFIFQQCSKMNDLISNGFFSINIDCNPYKFFAF